MQLYIRHETLYRYGEPVQHSIQNLRLTPRREPGQRTLSWQIVAPGRCKEQIDAHGNVVHLLTLDELHREVRIVVAGIVETDDGNRQELQDAGPLSPLAYLGETRLTQASEAIRGFAQEFLAPGVERSVALLGLAAAVSDLVGYEPGTTDVTDTAAGIFERRKGVCQDHAHVFIACCRSLGIPARYVSGYLYAGDPSRPDFRGSVASHAWVDAWLGETGGWLSIDVTNRSLANGRHCRVALGRDYLDACPVRGVRRGGGVENMHVDVSVSAQQQQQQ